MQNIWAMKTSPDLERDGIKLEIMGARITLARAGGINQKFNAAMEKLKRDHGKAIEGGYLNNDKGSKLIHAVFAEHVVRNWETQTGVDADGEGIWQVGIAQPNTDELAPFTTENVIYVFKEIPTIFAEVFSTAQNPSYYLQSILENASKN